MKTLTQSNIQSVKQKIEDSKTLIKGFTGISEDDYNTMFFELALSWAEKHTGGFLEANDLAKESFFWGFWKLQFNKFEERFIEMITYTPDLVPYMIVMRIPGQLEHVQGDKEILIVYKRYMEFHMTECVHSQDVMQVAFHRVFKKKAVQ